jgi:peptidoglycan/LPS O-acetylase OafA/YrhL
MQPLAMFALASGLLLVAAVVAALARRDRRSRRSGVGAWHRHGSIPLAAAGLALAVVSRGSGQSAATHDVLYGEAVALLVAAVGCAIVGAADATRRRAGGNAA